MRPQIAVLLAAVAWIACGRESPGRRAQALIDRLPAQLRARVDQSSVPVLLPRELNLERASLVVERTYSALSLPLPGITVSLHSARIAHRYPGIGGGAAGRASPMRGTTGYTAVNEGIRTATWIEDGVANALDLECADPGDARCADDTLLLALVDSLAVAGGGSTR